MRLSLIDRFRVIVMVFNATFNNISVLSWRLVLLVEETTNRYTLSHNVVSSTPRLIGIRTLKMIDSNVLYRGAITGRLYYILMSKIRE